MVSLPFVLTACSVKGRKTNSVTDNCADGVGFVYNKVSRCMGNARKRAGKACVSGDAFEGANSAALTRPAGLALETRMGAWTTV